jgi:hypothetical protein
MVLLAVRERSVRGVVGSAQAHSRGQRVRPLSEAGILEESLQGDGDTLGVLGEQVDPPVSVDDRASGASALLGKSLGSPGATFVADQRSSSGLVWRAGRSSRLAPMCHGTRFFTSAHRANS